ncbi:MAG: TylF/MycF/NovP-related O-methyltransferase [Acidimicrobiales bacterium]
MFHPSDRWREEFLALKTFMRRAFQVVAYNGIDGDYVEFGCCGGRTFTLAWRAAHLVGYPTHLWAFDSFQGLPATNDPRDDHPGWVQGAMRMTEGSFRELCAARGIPSQGFTTVAGFYTDSLAPEAEGPRPDRISVAYVDCDLYTSTTQVLEFLNPRLRHGMVLAFDDYYCFGPSTPSGERLATAEFFGASERWQLLPYLQFGWYGMSFIVEDKASGPSGVVGW